MRLRPRFAAIAALTIAAATAALVTPATNAEAVSATDFDPGMIITDAKFYDGAAMTATQIQSFLNSKVPTCHPEKDEFPADITCLKDFKQKTTAKSADAYCKGYSVKTQTAAQIIDGVARSCGVSQKVILVTLQKEQGLVTHDWPSSRRYDKAMGYACPDNAPCDTQYSGFFNQVYMAARQFKRYQALPQNYGYRAGRVNVIKYHPTNSKCTTKDVYIENQATAGLYNYTPYVPNRAALLAGYGKGDGCSSYGNRNFFMYYSDWFGSTTGYAVDGKFASAYASRGGVAALGEPVSAAIYVAANGGGWYQRFAKGTLYVTRSGIGTYRPSSYAVSRAYDAAGGPAGSWGWPLTDTVTFNGKPLVEFQHLRVAWIDGGAVLGYPFSDVSDNRASSDYTEHAASIFWMERQDISTGWITSRGTEYRPFDDVSRDAMAAFLYRFSGATTDGPATSTFPDVTAASSEFYNEIEWLVAEGITTGWSTPDGTRYRPYEPTTRDAMAAFLFRLLGDDAYVAPATSPFVDVKPTNTFYREISWLASTGISTGWSTSKGKEYRPYAPIDRAAMAAFLLRASDLR